MFQENDWERDNFIWLNNLEGASKSDLLKVKRIFLRNLWGILFKLVSKCFIYIVLLMIWEIILGLRQLSIISILLVLNMIWYSQNFTLSLLQAMALFVKLVFNKIPEVSVLDGYTDYNLDRYLWVKDLMEKSEK